MMGIDIVSYLMGKAAGGGGGGGGGGAGVAAISCSYPAGTTATCSNGTTTLTSDTSGLYLFQIPSAGTWAISNSGATKTVSLTAGMVANVVFAMVDFSPLKRVMQGSYSTGATVFTALEPMRVLAINTNQSVNTTSNERESDISTTGSVVASDSRDISTTDDGATSGSIAVNIIDLAAGDSVTLTNNSGSDSRQIHLVYQTRLATLSNVSFLVWPDVKGSNSVDVAASFGKNYLAIAVQASNYTRQQTISANITGVSDKDTYKDNYYAYAIGLASNVQGYITLSTEPSSNYVSSMVAVYEVTA